MNELVRWFFVLYGIAGLVLIYKQIQMLRERTKLIARIEELETALKPYQTKDEAFFLAEPDKWKT